jgi:hypothetical protein
VFDHMPQVVEHILNDGRRGGHNAGWYRERAGQGFAEEFHGQDRGLARRWGEQVIGCASILV